MLLKSTSLGLTNTVIIIIITSLKNIKLNVMWFRIPNVTKLIMLVLCMHYTQ